MSVVAFLDSAYRREDRMVEDLYRMSHDPGRKRTAGTA